MDDRKRLVSSFLGFLADEVKANRPSEELTESLEVAMQCLESAYNVSPANDLSLLSLVQKQTNPFAGAAEAPVDAKEEAEKCKLQGNNLVKEDNHLAAIEQYTRAIMYDGKNAVYYCNRAAAYNKLGNFHAAVMDCKTAIQIDPSYSKAFGRMGVAYAQLKMHQDAIESYKKALELEPGNETYANNLRISQELVEQQSQQAVPNLGAAFQQGGFQFGQLLNNPALVNMATQLMNDPNMSQVMNDIMSGGSVDALMQAGQSLAQQLQSTNPELIDNFRRTMGQPPRETPPRDPENQ
ncbi:small glutamine-rich tetratricopeptide repeat-containing protein alpha [Neocloeon triangulifer]|uniref:small glutamine-rich tetratricopeptide repeat-containing protein alpha n=1 Tax=Neocloeon triangulifer TaxID=2078957 RepID=UPI00286EE2B5|nr:small glutamine-rich tetratricopeptide repeat-containing protein alpha [Neocloeon triangulifer]